MDWHAKVLQLRLRADDLNILGNASTAVAAVCILWLIWVAWFSGLGQPMGPPGPFLVPSFLGELVCTWRLVLIMSSSLT
jgi:hypothetical protein